MSPSMTQPYYGALSLSRKGSRSRSRRRSPSQSRTRALSRSVPSVSLRSETDHTCRKPTARDGPTHVCAEDGCDRGFMTTNDLVRHQASVHEIIREGVRMYRCLAPGCAKPEKNWPRKDNFRSHLRKAHPSENVDELVRRAEEWWDEGRDRKVASTGSECSVSVTASGPRSNRSSAGGSRQNSPADGLDSLMHAETTESAPRRQRHDIRYDSSTEWELYKPLIKRLYTIEHHTTDDIMAALWQIGIRVR